jgi:hypothetical protein
MQNSTVLPNLQILPTKLLVPHEECDPRRVEKLSRRILEEGILKNPPVVAALPESDRFVVLDGANRALSFQHAGVPHIVAQLVSYADPGVMVDTWYHVVSGMKLDEFEAALTQIVGVQFQASNLEESRWALVAEEALAYIICENGVRKVIPPAGRHRDISLLCDLVNAYKGKADIFRASNDIWEIQKPYYPDITGLIVFPKLRPADILHAAQNDYKIPTGITRHIIPARALNINIPLGILMADWTLEQKREWMQNWWMDRMAMNSIRYYAESTFSFNE